MEFKRVLPHPLFYRLFASLVLAFVGNASAAITSSERDVLNFKPASPIMRPQTTKVTAAKAHATGKPLTEFFDVEPDEPTTAPAQPPANNTPAKPVVSFPTVNTPPANSSAQTGTATPKFQQPVSTVIPAVSGLTTQGTQPLSNPPVQRESTAPPIAEPDNQNNARVNLPGCTDGHCLENPTRGSLSANAKNIADVKSELEKQTGNADLKDKLAINAVKEALRTRDSAHFCQVKYGYPPRMSGNRSKCACSQAAKDAWMDSGLCASRPPYEGAVELAGLPQVTTNQASRTGPIAGKGLLKYCPAFHQTKGRVHRLKDAIRAALDAPAGSIIVYSTSRHEYGHVETKVQVTNENIGYIGRKLKVKIGDYLYCSDFCRTGPTFSHDTNRIEAIYSL